MRAAVQPEQQHVALTCRTAAERDELAALERTVRGEAFGAPAEDARAAAWPKRAISASEVLNEASEYTRPSSFSRGVRIDLGPATLLLISGTASIDETGQSVHTGDFRAQLLRTYRNLTALLAAEGATWHDVVRTSCYLRDIERDYRDFNEIRTAFFTALGLEPLPASTGIQARLCREELLVEIELMAVCPTRTDGQGRHG